MAKFKRKPNAPLQSQTDLNVNFTREFLEAHNKYRHRHKVPELSINEELSAEATRRAQTLAELNKLQYRRQGNCRYGENIFKGANLTGDIPVNMWYTEIFNYKYEDARYTKNTRCFTQLVWRETKEVGVGVAMNGKVMFVVALYNPPGNIPGKFAANVPRPSEAQETASLAGMESTSTLKPGSSMCLLQDPNMRFIDAKFEKEFLEAHNRYRGMHRTDALVLQEAICNYAAEWSNYLATTGLLTSRPNRKYGEIVATLPHIESLERAADIVKGWYENIQHFDYTQPENVPLKAKNFTQLIWRKTEFMGFAINISNNGIFIVANYFPKGNIPGKYERNVLPLKPLTEIAVDKKEIVAEKSKSDNDFKQKQLENMRKHNLDLDKIEFSLEFLSTHNNYRKQHGVNYLVLNDKLTKLAEKHAQYLASINRLESSKQTEYGENMYVTALKYNFRGAEPVDFWYSQVAFYDFAKPSYSSQTKCFTQLIWRNSRDLGLGFAKNSEQIFVVAYYLPAGNKMQQFPDNVPPKLELEKKYEAKKQTPKSKPAPTARTVEPKQEHGKAALAETNLLDSRSLAGSQTQLRKPIARKPNDWEKRVVRFKCDCLLAHNAYRQQHNVVPLRMSQKLCVLAQKYAEAFAQRSTKVEDTLAIQGCEFGEHLYVAPGAFLNGHDPVRSWYDECANYNYRHPVPDMGTNHFTQIIWKGTQEIGLGVTWSRGATYVVILYYPRGNITNKFKENVLPVQKSSKGILKRIFGN